jgi:hypothetical protein
VPGTISPLIALLRHVGQSIIGLVAVPLLVIGPVVPMLNKPVLASVIEPDALVIPMPVLAVRVDKL